MVEEETWSEREDIGGSGGFGPTRVWTWCGEPVSKEEYGRREAYANARELYFKRVDGRPDY